MPDCNGELEKRSNIGSGLNPEQGLGNSQMKKPSGNIELSILEEHERAALFIRHSERVGAEIATEEDGLTQHGREMALDLGRSLRPFGPIRMFSSPVGRCMDSAKLIAEGAGATGEVVVSTNLGGPGVFVMDGDLVMNRLNKVGLTPFIESWFNEELPLTEVRSCQAGSQALMDWAIEELSSQPIGLDVHVSHDLDLTPVLVHYLGYDLFNEGLLGFLDGFVVWPEGQKYKIYYRGRQGFLS
jgi:Histidine phosphatase superfamily (branch 1)